jgi:hypothetical protein
MENSTSGNRVHHCRHPWCSRRSNDDVKDEHESLELHEFFSVLRLFVRFVRFVFKKNFAFNDTMENILNTNYHDCNATLCYRE